MQGQTAQLSRRELLKYGAVGLGGLILPLGLKEAETLGGFGPGRPAVRRAGGGSSDITSPSVKHFDVDLPIPPVLQPVRSDSTTDYYEVTMRQARVQILPNLTTTIWGYNGITPGPTIVARRGHRAVVRQINQLPEPMSVHYHGGVTPALHDGYPENLVQPGASWDYEYPNVQAAATNWYHDHAVHTTARHVYMGLAAMYLVRDDLETSFNLPQGPYEIPLVLQDRIFDSSGALVYDNNDNSGVVGDVQLVNGAPWPRLPVFPRKYRFRLLNGANWRRYDLTLSNGQPFVMLGTESGFLRAPVSLPMIRLYQAERADVVIDFSRVPVGSTVVLSNQSDEAQGTGMADIMRFDVVPMPLGGTDDSQLPATLAQYEDLTTPQVVAQAVRTREFRFERSNGAYVINGQVWDRNRVDANPRYGDVEIWKFINSSGGWYHPIHVHLVDFQILDRDGLPPQPWERGRKDVVALGENNTARVLIKWDPQQYQGLTGRYVMHCHNIDHEDHDMMTQFEVLA
jgi:FtsP/CotA-like multicopper oxidase with cupredoxin domain